jgi:cellulose synthase/poly-beta-1,6-N-acetylglucosamine synthase-like glycosyltransferase
MTSQATLTQLYWHPATSPSSTTTSSTVPLGQLLLRAGLVPPKVLDKALRLQQTSGSRLGEILVGMGALRGDVLARILATQHDFDVFDPLHFAPDAAPHDFASDDWYREQRLILMPTDDGTIRIATADPLNVGVLDEVQRRTGRPVVPFVASERDIEQSLHAVHHEENLYLSSVRLRDESPENSAHRVLTGGQRVVLGATGLAVLAALCWNWAATLTILVSLATLLHIAASLYRLHLLRLGWRSSEGREAIDTGVIDDRDLPVYTILVPLYKEAAVLRQLTDALQALDWPKAKLDVRLLLEADDVETIAAAREARLPAYFTFVIVPTQGPRGKPKACNYGLMHARGEYVVIYDAEDIPEPDQLKKVYATFQAAGPDLACVQCQLSFYNPEQNLLTRWFTAEYAMWFDILLPGLQRAGVPIPLGGTSNHFPRRVLEDLGAWDAYNITEDADLGVRLSKRGFRTAMLESVTYEEANPRVGNWLRQRSRWIKGYALTWLVHMRHPAKLLRVLGPRRFAQFQLLMAGNTYVLLLNPIYWLITALWFPTHSHLIEQVFPGPIYFLASLALYLGNFVFVYATMAGALDRGTYRLVKYALLSPLYWALMSIAAWKGVLQLIYAPSYWEKTTHGLAAAASAGAILHSMGGGGD